MKKVGVCGYFGEGLKTYNGQAVKTKTITAELENSLGHCNVTSLDTYNWRKRIIRLVFGCFKMGKNCENIIILPAQNGIKVFPRLFLLINIFYGRQLHYVVIGGWLPELLKTDSALRKIFLKFTGIYVETQSMVKTLTKMGFENIYHLPNFKNLSVIDEEEIVFSKEEPYKLCTFSRVMKEKGIEEAIDVTINFNRKSDEAVFRLDIFGPIDEAYKERFEMIKKSFPEYINYKGIIEPDNSVEVLKNYDLLLFPTTYEGEGFAGTILDAFASGLPVIATNWRYNAEIIRDHIDGFIYDYQNPQALTGVLQEVLNNVELIFEMKKNCLKSAKQYLPAVVMEKLLKHL